MLLVQWGIYNWGRGAHFDFVISRQFILEESDGSDAGMFELSLTFRFAPTEELRGFGRGSKWCDSPDEIHTFEEFVRLLPAYQSVALRSDVPPELHFGIIG
jgi:hypothetical protein